MCSLAKVFIISLLLVFSSFCVFSQDLGSSNKLFGGTKTTKAITAKKTSVKKKNTPTKAKTIAKSKTPSSKPIKTTRRSTQPHSKKADGEVVAKTTKVDILPVKTVETKIPVDAAANELFEKLIEDGNRARDERIYPAAEAAYQRAKAVKPKDPRAVYGLGNLYSDQQRWDEAEKSYRAALQLDPDNAIVHIALSYVLSQPIMISNLSMRYEEAEKLARRSIELAPSNSLAFDQLGVAMELGGLISTETENAYRNSIKLDTSFAPAYAHLGRLLRRRGQLKESAAAYESAIQRANDVPTMILVADVMQSEQRFSESEPLLRKAVESDPRNPAGLLLLGRALTTLGNFTDAERFLRRSLDVSPNGFMPNCLLGSLYSRQGKYELAESALLQALRFVSENEKRRLSLLFETVGDGYMRTGNARSGERAYKQAIALDKENESLADKLEKAQHN